MRHAHAPQVRLRGRKPDLVNALGAGARVNESKSKERGAGRCEATAGGIRGRVGGGLRVRTGIPCIPGAPGVPGEPGRPGNPSGPGGPRGLSRPAGPGTPAFPNDQSAPWRRQKKIEAAEAFKVAFGSHRPHHWPLERQLLPAVPWSVSDRERSTKSTQHSNGCCSGHAPRALRAGRSTLSEGPLHALRRNARISNDKLDHAYHSRRSVLTRSEGESPTDLHADWAALALTSRQAFVAGVAHWAHVPRRPGGPTFPSPTRVALRKEIVSQWQNISS